jgi:hypothetical protein
MVWIISNWYILLALIVLAIILGITIKKVWSLPKNEKIKVIKGLLLEWVNIAEKELGSGQGQAKLQLVYTMFVARFPVISRVIPFIIFSKWVDEALDKMEEMLSEKKEIKESK